MMQDRSTCEHAVRRMWEYLDGASPDADRAAVASHLAMCVACAAHFDFAAEFLRAVAQTRQDRPHTMLRDRIARALALAE